MLKKILSVVLAAMMIFAFATGCKKDGDKDNSSKKQPTSSVESIVDSGDEDDESSSAIADTESGDEAEGTNSYKWTIKTTSAFFRDTEEARETVSKSEEIKHYTNPGTYQIAGYQLHMQWLNAYGTDIQSKAKEFEDFVNSGYFNTFLLGADDENLHYELPLLAEKGYSFWLSTTFYNSKKTPIEDYIKRVQYYVDLVESYGCSELFLGFYWDEPILRGMTNEDLHQATKVHYVNFGLRSFPVFACGSFSDEEGNDIGDKAPDPDEWGKLSHYGAKYLTDISFDSYGQDVRPEAYYTPERLERMEEITGHVMEIKGGMDYYRAYKEWLFKCVGHTANFYYYPCAQEYGPTAGGITQTADEEYCLAHLEYMAEDVLNDERGGGLVLYNIPTNGGVRNLDLHIVLNDENGFPLMHPDEPKWEKYSAALLKVCEKFSATKQKIQYPVPKK